MFLLPLFAVPRFRWSAEGIHHLGIATEFEDIRIVIIMCCHVGTMKSSF